jgi:hypothetical protein
VSPSGPPGVPARSSGGREVSDVVGATGAALSLDISPGGADLLGVNRHSSAASRAGTGGWLLTPQPEGAKHHRSTRARRVFKSKGFRTSCVPSRGIPSRISSSWPFAVITMTGMSRQAALFICSIRN